MSERRCAAGSVRDLRGQVRRIALAREPDGRPREALVMLDYAGVPRAYLNQCRHLPIPLDVSGECLVDGLLQCGTHGARYQPEDGLCVIGPCRGLRLYALELVQEGEQLFVVDPLA
jgi:nitrite reductase/ring-hydroxylating ferredoxin subunit